MEGGRVRRREVQSRARTFLRQKRTILRCDLGAQTGQFWAEAQNCCPTFRGSFVVFSARCLPSEHRFDPPCDWIEPPAHLQTTKPVFWGEAQKTLEIWWFLKTSAKLVRAWTFLFFWLFFAETRKSGL